jgi:hypothetical protein
VTVVVVVVGWRFNRTDPSLLRWNKLLVVGGDVDDQA